MLEVHTTTGILVFLLALDDFNDWDQRRAHLAGLGHRCWQQGHTVTACRFGSGAWVRGFTQKEYAARDGRLIETYPDRQEAIVVMGETAAGETRIASAPLYRRPSGKVERVGTWEIKPYATMRSPLLEAFWRGYALATMPAME